MKFKVGNKIFEVSKEIIDGGPEEIILGENLIIRTSEEENSFIENHKKDARKEGLEIAIKKQREALGLEFQGKTIENLIEAVSKKALEDAKIEPAEQLKKLQTVLSEKENALQNAIKNVQDIEGNFSRYKSEITIDKELDSLIPEKTILAKDDIKLLIKNKLVLDIDENGKVVVKDKSGNILKNQTTADPLNPKDAIDDFFRSNPSYIGKPSGGSGQGDSGSGGKKQTIDEFINEQKEKGIAPNSKQFNDELLNRQKRDLIDLG